MKTKKESKTKASELEIIDDIFMVKKENKKLVGLKCDESNTPEHLVIPEGIEIIGPDVLFVSKNNFLRSNIKSVKFPDSLKKIENNAFFRCTDLTDIQFGNGLEYIGKIAFASCRGLEEIVLPDSLRVIESQAFMDCSKLKNVVFNEGLQVIEWSAFYICKNLNEFMLPKSLRVVGDEALQYAKKVTIHGELPHNLMRAVSPMSWTTHSEYTSRKWPMVVELVADDDTYFLPKYIELANASDCECALNSGIQEKMQTLYKYCNSGDASADTAYAEYIHLLKTGEEPCEDLRKYVKRMSKSITSRLIATGRNSEAAEFIGLGLLTPAASKDLYEDAVNKGNDNIAAYLMEEMKKNNKKHVQRIQKSHSVHVENIRRLWSCY